MGNHGFINPSSRASPPNAPPFVQNENVKTVVGQQTSSRRAGQTSTDDDDRVRRGGSRAVGKSPIGLHVKPGAVGSWVALSNQTENRSGWVEGPVKQAVAPLHADHRRGVATVQGVLVVEVLTPHQ